MSNDELEIMNCGVEPFLDLGIGLKRGLDSMLVDSGMIGMIGKELKGGLTDLSMVGQGPRIQSLDPMLVDLGMVEKGGIGTVGGGLKRRLDRPGVPGRGGRLKGGLLDLGMVEKGVIGMVGGGLGKGGLDSMLLDHGMVEKGVLGMVGGGLKCGLSNSDLVSVSLATVGPNLTSSGLCDSLKMMTPGLSTKWTAFSKDVVGTEGVRTILVLRVPNTASACVSSDTKS